MGTWLCLAGPVSTLRQLPRQWPGPRDARRPRLLVVASSVGQGTMQLLYQVSAMGRPALVSSPGPVFSSNNNNVATRKVVTAAHKLKSLEQTDLLKVRVGEYDASGFNAPEVQSHEEYTVTRILKHPQMSNTRLSNDLAILYVDRDIHLNHPYVNTACLPSCADQFDH